MDKSNLNLAIIGIILIITGVLTISVDFLQKAATNLLYPLLLGSSEGKAVLFFIIMGSLLVLNSLIGTGKLRSRFAFTDISDSKKYLKYTIIIVLFTYTIGIIIEIWLRLNFGVSLFTVFVSLNPDISSTSIIHSHIFKSALGYIISTWGAVVPSNIHTGDSLFKYVSPLAYIILITLPLAYITILLSMDSRMIHYRLIIAFAAALTLIGMVDGGLFSNPAIIGFAGLIGMYYVEKPFSKRNLIKPAMIVLVIILAGLCLEIGGSNTDYHQIKLINQTEPADLAGYDVISIENNNNTTIINLSHNKSDKEILKSLFNVFKGKADGFFTTWNFYSYF